MQKEEVKDETSNKKTEINNKEDWSWCFYKKKFVEVIIFNTTVLRLVFFSIKLTVSILIKIYLIMFLQKQNIIINLEIKSL